MKSCSGLRKPEYLRARDGGGVGVSWDYLAQLFLLGMGNHESASLMKKPELSSFPISYTASDKPPTLPKSLFS